MLTFEFKKDEEGNPAFYIAGEFQMSWHNGTEMPKMTAVLRQALEQAYKEGARQRGRDIKNLLG